MSLRARSATGLSKRWFSGKGRRGGFQKTWPLHLFLLPSVILLFLFNYIPMSGIVIAFQDYKPWLGLFRSKFVGLKHFEFLFSNPNTLRVISNTLLIATFKIAFGLLIPLLFALLLNEIRNSLVKRTIQSMVYLPHFLNWVILGGVLRDILSHNGIVNQVITAFGLGAIHFLGNGTWFRVVLVASDVWKEFGFGTIIYIAAIAGVSPSLYEAAQIDGANRFQEVLHVTLPSIVPIAIVLTTLSLGNILNAGFDQVFNLYGPMVYEQGDIIDTFVYRIGLIDGSFGFATAVGLFKSVVSFVLISATYGFSMKFQNYRIF